MKKFILIGITLTLVSFVPFTQLKVGKVIRYNEKNNSNELVLVETDSLKRLVIANYMTSFERDYEEIYPVGKSTSKKRKKNFIFENASAAVWGYIYNDDVLPSTKLAQAGVESSWGRAKGVKYHNYFNVKSSCHRKKKCSHKHKCHKLFDKVENSWSSYLSFPSKEASFKNHKKVLMKKRYAKVWKTENGIEQLREIRKGGYATLDYKKFMTMHGRISYELRNLDKIAIELKNKLNPSSKKNKI